MKRVLVLAMTLMLTVIGCDSGDGGDGGTTATSAAVGGEETVEIADLAFAPDELTVAVGSEVTWVNNDTVGLRPPLTITRAEIDEVVDTVGRALRAAQDEL